VKVAVVGAGFSGLGMAVALKNAGHDFTVFEAADDVGGVWHHNTYPGAACDVPSYLYSYSWAQRRDWPHPCSPQQEIHRYLRGIVADHGLAAHLRLNTAVARARWGDGWKLETTDGERLEFDALVLACGQLSRPAFPCLDGEFGGAAFHSAEWDHSVDLRGKRVAVIGTGASAVQFVPRIAEQAASLDVYQRTPAYMMPRRNPVYSGAAMAALRNVGGLQWLRRHGTKAYMELMTLGLLKVAPIAKAIELNSRAFLRYKVRDPELRRKLTPDYRFGCKRILFSSYYYEALQRPNTELVTDSVERLTADGVVAGGRERPADVIIYGTGFRAQDFVAPLELTGADGLDLLQAWAGGAEAHLGITVAGFPNAFLLYGPNTNLGVGSIIVMIEAQVGYVMDALRLAATRGALSVRPEIQQASSAVMQARLRDSVWTACDSWYRDDAGRVVNNWPGFMGEYERLVARVDPAEYEFSAGSALA